MRKQSNPSFQLEFCWWVRRKSAWDEFSILKIMFLKIYQILKHVLNLLWGRLRNRETDRQTQGYSIGT